MRSFTRNHPPPSSTSSRERSNVRAPSSSARARLTATRERARRDVARSIAHNVGAACGDSLRHLATTADGYTLDNPYGNVALWTDVDGWRQLCRDLMARCREHFDALGALEAPPFPRWEGLRERFNAIVEKHNALDEVGGKWTGSGVSEAIAYCTTLAAEQICFLEDADKAIVELGGTPPGYPGTVKPAPPPASPHELVNTVVKAGALALGVVVVVTLLRR